MILGESSLRSRATAADYSARRPDTPPAPKKEPIFLSLYGPNQWPESPDTFERSITSLRKTLGSIARVIIDRIAESLTAEPTLFTAPFSSSKETPCYSRMKVVSYPPSGPDVDPASLGESRLPPGSRGPR